MSVTLQMEERNIFWCSPLKDVKAAYGTVSYTETQMFNIPTKNLRYGHYHDVLIFSMSDVSRQQEESMPLV